MSARSILGLLVLLAAAPVQAGRVEMCVDDACAAKIKRQKLDCAVHKNKKKVLTVGFKVGAFVAKAGPEVSFGRSAEINWNRMSQELIRRYEELCDMHNKGHLSVAGFNQRYEKLESYYDKAKDLKEEINDTVAGRADKAFKDLDDEVRMHEAGADSSALKERIKKIAQDIDVLSKNVQEAKPAEESDPGARAAKPKETP